MRHPPSDRLTSRIVFGLLCLAFSSCFAAAASVQPVKPDKNKCSTAEVEDAFKMGGYDSWFAPRVADLAARTKNQAIVTDAVSCVWAKLVDLEDKKGKSYNDLSRVLASLRLLDADPDLYDLRIRAYAAAVFSNLFREKPTDGYFSKSRPYFLLTVEQTVTGDRALDTFGNFAFRGQATVTETNAVETIQQSNELTGEVGVRFWPNLIMGAVDRGHIGVGGIVAGGFVGVPEKDASGAETTSDNFKGTVRAGIAFRILTGIAENSFAEYCYARDPRFPDQNRFFARARLVVSGKNDGSGHGVGGFIEGSFNSGKGTDEARLVVGAVLPVDKIIDALFGGGSSGNGNGNGTGSSGQ